MKICFVTDDISILGGLQRVTTVIVNELSKIPNIDVTLLLTSNSNISSNLAYEINSSVNIIISDEFSIGGKEYPLHRLLDKLNRRIIPLRNINLLKKIYYPNNYVNKFNSYFNNNYYDVIIGVAPRFAGLVSLLTVKSTKIGWLHSTYERYFELKTEYSNQEQLYKILFSYLDDLIVLTDSGKKIYKEKFKITPTSIYNPLSVTPNSKNDLLSNNILYVGRIFYDTKGLELLLEAMVEIIQLNPNIILNIVGDGPDQFRLLEDIERLRLQDNVLYHGSTNNVEIYYLNSSLLVMPSIVEGFGLVVTEAMSFGLPVVSFQTEGPSELISDGINGFLVPNFNKNIFANKVVEVMNDYTLRKKMGQNAHRRSKDFNVDSIIKQWVDLLEYHVKENLDENE